MAFSCSTRQPVSHTTTIWKTLVCELSEPSAPRRYRTFGRVGITDKVTSGAKVYCLSLIHGHVEFRLEVVCRVWLPVQLVPGPVACPRHYSREKEVFLVKLCEICQRKAHSKFKEPLVPMISTKLFGRVQIDLINIRSSRDITTTAIFKYIAHFVCYMSKIRILLVLPNKEAVIIATAVSR